MDIERATIISRLILKTLHYYANLNLVTTYQDLQTDYQEYSDEDVPKFQFIR